MLFLRDELPRDHHPADVEIDPVIDEARELTSAHAGRSPEDPHRVAPVVAGCLELVRERVPLRPILA